MFNEHILWPWVFVYLQMQTQTPLLPADSLSLNVTSGTAQRRLRGGREHVQSCSSA